MERDVQSLDRLGDEVQVRHRNDGQIEARHLADFAPHSPAAFTTISVLIVPLSVTTSLTRPSLTLMPVTFVCKKNFRAARFCAGGECLRQAGRVNAAVGRRKDRAKHAFGIHQREHLLRFGGADQFERQAERARERDLALEFFQSFRR